MADEKILKDEVLTDEQLDGVAGGTKQQNIADLKFLQEIGVLKGDFDSEHEWIMQDQSKIAWAQVGVVALAGVTNTPNRYYDSKGKEISRADAYKIAAKKMHSKIDYSHYLRE